LQPIALLSFFDPYGVSEYLRSVIKPDNSFKFSKIENRPHLRAVIAALLSALNHSEFRTL